MERQIPGLLALAGDVQMRHAAPCVPEVLDLQLAQLLAPQRVIEKRRQDGAIALLFDGFLGRSKKLAGLMITDRWRLAFAAFSLGPLDAFDWVVADGIFSQRYSNCDDSAASRCRTVAPL
jgi:hypothetical protein